MIMNFADDDLPVHVDAPPWVDPEDWANPAPSGQLFAGPALPFAWSTPGDGPRTPTEPFKVAADELTAEARHLADLREAYSDGELDQDRIPTEQGFTEWLARRVRLDGTASTPDDSCPAHGRHPHGDPTLADGQRVCLDCPRCVLVCTVCGQDVNFAPGGALVHVPVTLTVADHNATLGPARERVTRPANASTPAVRAFSGEWYTDPRLAYARGLTDGFNNGVAGGIRLAHRAIDEAIKTALARPEGHGGPDLDVHVQEMMRGLYSRYLGTRRDPDSFLEHGPF